MGDSLETTEQSSAEVQNVVVVDVAAFSNYLRKAIQIFWDEFIPPAFNVALEERSTQEYIKKFISDSQVQALYLQRCSSKGECVRGGEINRPKKVKSCNMAAGKNAHFGRSMCR